MSSPSDARWSLSRRELTLIFLFWTALATLSAVSRLLDTRDANFTRMISPAGPIALAYVEAWIWAAFTPLIFWLSSQTALARSRWVKIPLLILAGIAISIAVFVLLNYARGLVMPVPVRRRGPAPGFMPLREIGRFRFLNQLIVYGAIVAAGFAREFFVRDQQRQREALALASQTATLKAQLADARLDALRMQLNPHFLFNTLHAVSALVERDPSGVRKMIARLGELLRHTIDSHATDEVPLRDELAFLRRYLEIMEVRFQGRLKVALDVGDDLLDALVPNLILQPLVENALEHGVSRSTGEGDVSISATRAGESLRLCVRDHGPGLAQTTTPGVGLDNTRARLEQLYGGQASLSLLPADGGGLRAEIALPFHTHQDLRFEDRADV